MDFIVQLPRTEKGNTQIVVFVDRLTKMVHLAALPEEATSVDVARCFLHNVFRLHGLPKALVTDRDAKFTGVFWSEVTRLLGTARHMSTAYHPQTDGQTERANKVLEDMLRHWVSPSLTSWDTLLDCAEFAINNAFNHTTGSTPFRLNAGQDPLTPLSIEAETRVPAAADFVTEMHDSLQQARVALLAAQERQKAYFDKGRRPQEFSAGQKVLLKSSNLNFKVQGARKLLPKWVGPFEVLAKVGNCSYRLQLPPSLPVHPVFHTSLLREFKDDGRHQPPPAPVELAGQQEFEVETLLGRRKRGAKREYLVRWKGWGAEYDSWEPLHNLRNCRELLEEYDNTHGVAAQVDASQA
jgi:hypothetical protein